MTTNAMTVFKSRFLRMHKLSASPEVCMKLIQATCVLHNIALMNEDEGVSISDSGNVTELLGVCLLNLS